MKKWYCVILCMLMSALAVSGQTADVGSTATVNEGSTVIEKNDTASALDAAEKDRAASLPADAETSDTAVTEPDADILPAAEPAANTVSEDTQAETVRNTDGSTESVSSPSASINEAGDAADTTTVISTGKDRDETQEQKDILQPVEMNEPTQRTKQRPLSMHSGLMIAVTGANNVFSFFDFF